MNSKILKLDPPYNIIYAGGRIGKHIATLTIWADDDMEEFGARQYAMLDEAGKLPAGALATEAELQDCRVICNERDPRVGLCNLAEITAYDMKQMEPVEFGYIWERLELLGVKPIWRKAKNEDGEVYDENVYEISLSFNGTHNRLIAQSYTTSGFYFYARGTVEEVYRELHYQHGVYESCFYDDNLLINFKTPDGWEQHIVDLLNQRKASYTPADNEEKLI